MDSLSLRMTRCVLVCHSEGAKRPKNPFVLCFPGSFAVAQDDGVMIKISPLSPLIKGVIWKKDRSEKLIYKSYQKMIKISVCIGYLK